MRKLYSVRGAIQAAANNLKRNAIFHVERATFALLLILLLSFAVEALRRPILIGAQYLTNLDVLQSLVIGAWLVCRCLSLLSGIRGRTVPRGLAVAIALWLAALLISTLLTSEFRRQTLAFDGRILKGVLIAWITFDLTPNRARWTLAIRCMALGGIVVYVLGIAEVARVTPIWNWLVSLRGAPIYAGELLRLSSTLAYPNIAAIIIEMTLFPVLAWTIVTERRWAKYGLAAALLLGSVALILTFSRGALLAFSGSLLIVGAVVVLSRNREGQRRTIILAGGIVLACLVIITGVLVLSNPTVALRLLTESDQSWYQVDFAVATRVSARPGETLTIPVRVTNTGQRTWQAGGNHAIHLSYHLLRLRTRVNIGQISSEMRQGLLYEGQRTSLPHDLAPGESIMVAATVVAPPEVGEFLIQWDMVQENVVWFSAKNAATADTRLTLNGSLVDNAASFAQAPYLDVSPRPSPSRLTLWSIALRLFQTSPWVGIGPDNFRHVYGRYLDSPVWSSNIHANNLYVELLADTGLIGLGAFLLMSLLAFRLAWRGWRLHHRDSAGLWQLALLGSLYVWYLHGVVDYFYEFSPANLAYWIVIGLIASSAQPSASRPEKRPPERV